MYQETGIICGFELLHGLFLQFSEKKCGMEYLEAKF